MLHSQRADSASVKLREMTLTNSVHGSEVNYIMLGVFTLNVFYFLRIILVYYKHRILQRVREEAGQ